MEQNTQEIIQNVCKLIKTSGTRKFKKAGKLKFAYAYWNLTDMDIVDLYNFLVQHKNSENAKLANTLGLFIDDQYISEYRKFYSGIYNQSPETICKVINSIKTNGNWLSLYDPEREFSPKSTLASPVIYSYLIKDNNVLTIDKERANKILGILTDANIPTAKCIVTASFPYYAHNDMDTYITSFQKTK